MAHARRKFHDLFVIWLGPTLGTVSQKGDTAKAINYALNQWAALTLYVDDGGVEIDNNAAERALRWGCIWRRLPRPSWLCSTRTCRKRSASSSTAPLTCGISIKSTRCTCCLNACC